ncbi:hypothetical protein ACF08M_30280 [Streptomyces sp. NPDC015032]|uniref:hypothetical protein n=1 Tax=Streptomyces sp. NPDC015032 TaxID=3364937 RepID=UPI0036F71B4C
MSAVAILQETLPFDFEAGTSLYTEEDRVADRELCKAYFFGWTDAFGTDRPAHRSITFEEFQAAAERLAQ